MSGSPFADLFQPPEPLVLASSSPRRRQLLEMVGASFEIAAPAEESPPGDGPPEEVVVELAREKALSVSRGRPGAWVLGADTLVYLEGRALGKPTGEADAVNMVGRLAGRWHTVYTGLCLARGEQVWTAWESSRVKFLPMDPGEIRAYVRSGEPLDKAGAYGIQGYGALWIERIEGCYFNVMGLPLSQLARLLREVRASEIK